MESKSAFELSDNLKNAFAVFIDVKEFKIFLFDEILNSLKDFTKPWEVLKKNYQANILNSYFCSFAFSAAIL